MRMMRLKIRYPKLMLLLLTFVAAYFLFKGREFPAFHGALLSLGYFGTFLAGFLFTYGFTAAPAIAVLLILAKGQNIVLSGIIGGAGALLGDWIIFNFIRSSFSSEFRKLSRERVIRYATGKVPRILKRYLIPVLAGFIIASPLPDELGVFLLASSRNISPRIFSVISYIFNTFGIFIILLVGKAI